MAIVCLFLFSCCLLQWNGVGSVFTPVVYPAKILSSSQCGQRKPLQDKQLMNTLNLVQQQLPLPGCSSPLRTCKNFLLCNSSASSDYYQIQAANCSMVEVYCDMEEINCGGEGGWMRMAHLNMTDPSSQCPANFILHAANNKRFCIRSTTTSGCRATLFESIGHNYSQVCGYVRGYSFRTTDAFAEHGRGSNVPLSGNYVDGVSITYSTPPAHIWTYAAGYSENGQHRYACPCNTGVSMTNVPSYVGSDYYCESGTTKLIFSIYGTPMIPCGMVRGVGKGRGLAVTTLDCPGLVRAYKLPQLLILRYGSVWIKEQEMKMLELSSLSSM